MAKRYILGQTVARWLHEAMNDGSSVGVGRSDVIVTPTDAADPFTVRYSASVTNGATTGGWIIWIPDGAFSGAKVDTTTMRALTPSTDRMPNGWYLLPADIQSALSANGSHSLYANAALGKIVFSTSVIEENKWSKVAEVNTDTANASNSVKRVARSILYADHPRPFDIRKTAIDTRFENTYYNVGERTYYANVTFSPSQALNKIVALRILMTGTSPSASIAYYASLQALQTAQASTDYATVPLYVIGPQGEVQCDLRSAPRIVAGEFAQ